MCQDPGRRPDHTVGGRGAARRGWLLRRPTFAGLAVALLFWWWSLDPSMLSRAWTAQGAVSGLSAAIGYLCRGRSGGPGVGQPASKTSTCVADLDCPTGAWLG
jgi:hypothetical protein